MVHIPKLDVAGSSPVSRSILFNQSGTVAANAPAGTAGDSGHGCRATAVIRVPTEQAGNGWDVTRVLLVENQPNAVQLSSMIGC